MNPRLGALLAWGQWVFFLVCIGFGLIFWSFTSSPLRIVPVTFAFFSFATFGAVIASRRPGNAIGWLFCAVGIGTALTYSTGAYVAYGASGRSGSLPGLSVLDWLGNLVWPVNLGFGALLLLLFPDGHPLSRRWRPVVWIVVAAVVGQSLSSALMPGRFSGEMTTNPFGIAGAASILSPISNAIQGVFLFTVLAAIVSVVLRFWGARGDQRQQLKWFALCVVLGSVCVIAGLLFLPENGNLGFSVGFAMIPIGAGIAVLKYRLYDIDILINRTLVYGSLTTVLALIYFGSVYGAQSVLNAMLPGQAARQSPIIVVATTLLVAALFTPLRRRFQASVDRRFYRRKYDAAKMLAHFGATLRSEVNLDDLTAHLVGIVDQTMQPAHVSLWLRPTTPGERQTRPMWHTTPEG